jgi:hypothetical protein
VQEPIANAGGLAAPLFPPVGMQCPYVVHCSQSSLNRTPPPPLDAELAIDGLVIRGVVVPFPAVLGVNGLFHILPSMSTDLHYIWVIYT